MKRIARKLFNSVFRRRGANVEPIEVPQEFTHVHIIDTSVATDNIGDEIIVESARAVLAPYLEGVYVSFSSSHDGLGRYGRGLVKNADIALILGTNIISHRNQLCGQGIWKVSKEDVDALKNKVVLLGCGASRDFDVVDSDQIEFLKTTLSDRYTHSVRDQLGQDIVEQAGHHAVNTSCPTLWGYPWGSADTSSSKSDSVVFTLTKHKPHENDAIMVEILQSAYERLAFWPQQPRDFAYLRSLGFTTGINVIPPSLQEFDNFLMATGADVVGTRLHGGIRGLQHGCRSVIVSIDNRARGIGEHVGLPTLDRESIGSRLEGLLHKPGKPELTIPRQEIAGFLEQFSNIKSSRY